MKAPDENGDHYQHHELELTESKDDAERDGLLIPAGGLDDSNTKMRKGRRLEGGGGIMASNGVSPLLMRKARRKGSAAGDHHHHHTITTTTAVCIKYAALFLLVAQMVGLVLLMRYSRTHRDPTEPLYLASTAVFVMEIMKLVICLGVITIQSNGALRRELHIHVWQSPLELVKLTVPSLLYTIQNNLLYLALTNLDAATYQVCYQLKILTTALFSALLLGRTFSSTKWASLVILTLGVTIVQISGSGDSHSSNHNNDAAADGSNSNHRVVGLVAVLCAACTSGFSGVYFERILKGSRTSLWLRNVQMGLPSCVIAYLTVYLKDAALIRQDGFFQGYNKIVWTVVIVQAVGGLIVATVVKYADNVLKVFATSFSIIISCVISAFLFEFSPSLSFVLGASLVVCATVLYSSPERKSGSSKRKPILPTTASPRK